MNWVARLLLLLWLALLLLSFCWSKQNWLMRGVFWGLSLVTCFLLLGGGYQAYTTWKHQHSWLDAWEQGVVAALLLLRVFWPLGLGALLLTVTLSWLVGRWRG
ncbi:hypothetical protein [Desulfothermobacter acidiphilus]|uniref:hypothetical protein n=1 Tax=Desulfothermobacter acidiphilus TaxID=1938353 RepID=UPI003F8C2BEB